MPHRRDFLKIASAAALTSTVMGRVHGDAPPAMGAVVTSGVHDGGLKIAVGPDTLLAKAITPHILRLDLLAGGKSDPHTPVLDPQAKFSADPSAKLDPAGSPISLRTGEFELRIRRNPCRLTILDKSGKILLDQHAGQSLHVNPQNQAQSGFAFGHDKNADFYGIHTSACWSKTHQPVLKNGTGVANDTYKIDACIEGGGGAPFTWTTAGFGILVDSDGGAGYGASGEQLDFHKAGAGGCLRG